MLMLKRLPMKKLTRPLNENDKMADNEAGKGQFDKLRDKGPQGPGNSPQGGGPKRPFNFYWIYAVSL